VDLLKSQVGGCASWRRSGTAITDVVLFFCGTPGGFVDVNCRVRQPEEYSAAAVPVQQQQCVYSNNMQTTQ
jgi:hypothetical protein